MRVKKSISVAMLAMAIGISACGDNANTDGKLDTLGGKIEEGAKDVKEKLDAAATDVKAEYKQGKIKAMLGEIKGLENVDVDVDDSTNVTLRGTVATPELKARAVEIVTNTKAVTSVKDEIVVSAAGDTTTVPPPDTSKK